MQLPRSLNLCDDLLQNDAQGVYAISFYMKNIGIQKYHAKIRKPGNESSARHRNFIVGSPTRTHKTHSPVWRCRCIAKVSVLVLKPVEYRPDIYLNCLCLMSYYDETTGKIKMQIATPHLTDDCAANSIQSFGGTSQHREVYFLLVAEYDEIWSGVLMLYRVVTSEASGGGAFVPD